MCDEKQALKELKQQIDDLTKVVLADREFILLRLKKIRDAGRKRAKTLKMCEAIARDVAQEKYDNRDYMNGRTSAATYIANVIADEICP